MTQKKAAATATAPAPAPDPPADKEEEGWFTFIITYKHRHIWLKTELVSKCHFFTDDEFAKEAEEEKRAAAQEEVNVEPEPTKEPSKESPKNLSKWNQSLNQSHRVSRCLGSLEIGCWFTLHSFKSVSLITGTTVSSTSIDERDLINVTDPVRKIASQAMAELNLNLPKPNQSTTFDADKKAKHCVKTAVRLLTDLPEVPDYISKSALKKRVTQSGK